MNFFKYKIANGVPEQSQDAFFNLNKTVLTDYYYYNYYQIDHFN